MSILSSYGGSCGSCGVLNATPPTMSGGGKPLKSMTVAQLKEMAKKRNISGRSKATTKQALVELIRKKSSSSSKPKSKSKKSAKKN